MPEVSTQSRTVPVPGGELELSWASVTDTGRRREVNQDAVFASFPLFVVADGMGGHVGGEIAGGPALAEGGLVRAEVEEKVGERLALHLREPGHHPILRSM